MTINEQEYEWIKVPADTITTDDYFGKYWILGIHEGATAGYAPDTLGFTLLCPGMGESKRNYYTTRAAIVGVWRKVATTENETKGVK